MGLGPLLGPKWHLVISVHHRKMGTLSGGLKTLQSLAPACAFSPIYNPVHTLPFGFCSSFLNMHILVLMALHTSFCMSPFLNHYAHSCTFFFFLNETGFMQSIFRNLDLVPQARKVSVLLVLTVNWASPHYSMEHVTLCPYEIHTHTDIHTTPPLVNDFMKTDHVISSQLL